MSYQYRYRKLYEAEVNSFVQRVTDLKGTHWTRVYYLNFMFGQLPQAEQVQRKIMEDEVMRVYSKLLTREVRRPRSPGVETPDWVYVDLPRRWDMPIFIGSPDLPVIKRDKRTNRLLVPNDGLHFNGLLLLSRLGRGKFDPGRDLNTEGYVPKGGSLERIHVTSDVDGEMADYTLKAINSGRVAWDELLILPRAMSELADR